MLLLSADVLERILCATGAMSSCIRTGCAFFISKFVYSLNVKTKIILNNHIFPFARVLTVNLSNDILVGFFK